MENQQKKIFLNPVMSAPWKPQTYENSFCAPTTHKNSTHTKLATKALTAKNKRIRNVETLMTRFPGLKKYQAKAALTMSKNVLEKAIVLLEVSNCCRCEIIEQKIANAANLKNIHINVEYSLRQQDLSLRNISFMSSVVGENDSNMCRCELEERVGQENVPPNTNSNKIGVVITRTVTGYKAAPLCEYN